MKSFCCFFYPNILHNYLDSISCNILQSQWTNFRYSPAPHKLRNGVYWTDILRTGRLWSPCKHRSIKKWWSCLQNLSSGYSTWKWPSWQNCLCSLVGLHWRPTGIKNLANAGPFTFLIFYNISIIIRTIIWWFVSSDICDHVFKILSCSTWLGLNEYCRTSQRRMVI